MKIFGTRFFVRRSCGLVLGLSMCASVSADPSLGERWARPHELRGKKMIGTGQCSLQAGQAGITIEFLLANPDFCANHPFDGLALTVPVDPQWTRSCGLADERYVLDDLIWSRHAVPYSAVEKSVQDLQKIRWAHVTDNFLWYRLSGEGREGPQAVDLANDRHWAVIEQNAATAARICREAGLKGFLLDTEQYGHYERLHPEAKKNENGELERSPFPLGIDRPELLRQRGRQWIRAVQAECPQITIVIFFAWSPDLDAAGFLAGVKDFLNGVLEGIEGSARLVHGYENTFYYGQAARTRYTEEGFPGGRARYQATRDAIQQWQSYSTDPHKFNKYVEPGMAAWVESDPWDLWDGYPSGTRETIWSNLPLALAYTDEYVWVWSEHTHYGHSYQRGEGPNPFLWSLNNQTFNTGKEATDTVQEDFSTNPLLRGWYFDFDMLEIGRQATPDQPNVFRDTAVPYTWSPAQRALRVQGNWMSGPRADVVADFRGQRRRFVHPLHSITPADVFRCEFDITIERFSEEPGDPMVLGLFRADDSVATQMFGIRIHSPSEVHLTLATGGDPLLRKLPLQEPLKTGVRYRVVAKYDGPGNLASIEFTTSGANDVLGSLAGPIPSTVNPFAFDELGFAMWDDPQASKPIENSYVLHIHRAAVAR